MRTKAVQLLVNAELPPEMRDFNRPLDARGLGKLFHELAVKSPERYAAVLKRVGDAGREAAYWQGESMGLDDLRDVIDTQAYLAQMDKELAQRTKGVKDPKELRSIREDVWNTWASRIEADSMKEALRRENAVGLSVASGARGKPLQLRAMLATPGMFEDSKGKTVPLFARRSYARGVSPGEWLAGTYGARSAVTSTKRCLSPETKVRMADGTVRRLADVRAGDMVLGANLEGCTFPTRVVRVWDQGEQDVLEWTFRVGYGMSNRLVRLQSTEDHKILATSLRGYARERARKSRGSNTNPASFYHEKYVTTVGDLKGKNFAAVLSGKTEAFAGADNAYAFVLGLLAGDGCLSASKQTRGVRLLFSCADSSLLDDLNVHVLPSLGLQARRMCKDNYDCEITRTGYKASDNRSIVKGQQGFRRNARFAEKDALIASGMWRKYAHEKELPPDFRSWSYDSMCRYLAGLFTADGGFSLARDTYMVFSFHVAARKLAYQVADVLRWLFGVYISPVLEETTEVTRFGVTTQRNNALHGFQVSAHCELKNMEDVWKHMQGAKGRLMRGYMAAWRPVQSNPYIKAYRLGGVPVGRMNCLDLEVEHPDHLFVLDNGLIVSNSTAKGGFIGKQLAQTAAHLMVTEKDCGTDNGIDLAPDDPRLRYRFLAHKAGSLEANTLLDRKELAALQNSGWKKPVLVRSPMTCNSKNGVCAKCLGADSRGDLYPVGYAAGVTSANAIGEPLAQAALNVKHCLLKGTRVRMADLSVKPIEDIRVGDMVLGSDKMGKTFPVRVSHTWDQGMQEVQQYTYRRGQTRQYMTVVCTDKHEILSNRKTGAKQRMTSLKLPAGLVNSHLAAVLPSDAPTHGKHEALALLCGILLGDGIRWPRDIGGPPKISCADPVFIDDLNRYLQPHRLKAVKSKRSHDYRLVFTGYTCNGQRRCAVSGRILADPAKQHPLKQQIYTWGMAGKYAHEKRLPHDYLAWDRDSVTALLAGLIATDGSVGVNGAGQPFVSIGSTSREMLEQIKQLLELRLCVYAGAVSRTGKAGTKSYVHDMHTLYITRQDQVARLLAMLPPIPGIKQTNANKAASVCASRVARNPEPFFRAKRKKISAMGVGHCFDISVEHEDELFVLENGLIVSNTSGAASAKKTYSGLDWLIRFLQIPDNFPDRAPVAQEDGRVTVTAAPQGGHYVYINQKEHYVPQGLEVKLKTGDAVEEGEPLSEGIVRPDDVVRHRGVGEGRRYYSERLDQMLRDSGVKIDPRHTEIIARAAVDHVRVIDPEDDSVLPDDMVQFSRYWKNRPEDADTKRMPVNQAVGNYLQNNALHYTPGTRLTPKMAARLAEAGIAEVPVSPSKPKFVPEMVRMQTQSFAQPDWLAAMGTSYLGRQLSQRAVRGADTNIEENINYVPRVAYGENFGRKTETTGMF